MISCYNHYYSLAHIQGIRTLRPIMDLGEGAYIASFKDPDGNILRF